MAADGKLARPGQRLPHTFGRGRNPGHKSVRRFVWDEMAFLQHWWENDATESERSKFKHFVQARRIEMVDNGWSQHDMGSTTLDSMLNNWVEGHEWIRANLGAEYEPRIGWSLDPFGMSSSQAVLQALQGMDAWFFTRLSGSEVDARKAAKSLEFVWRASSSLPNETSEIFCHVYESYYCMPSDFQFEWSASFPNATTLLPLARKLAALAVNRSKWFRTRHVQSHGGATICTRTPTSRFRAPTCSLTLLMRARASGASPSDTALPPSTSTQFTRPRMRHRPQSPVRPAPRGAVSTEVRVARPQRCVSRLPRPGRASSRTKTGAATSRVGRCEAALPAGSWCTVRSERHSSKRRKVSSGERAALWARLEQARRNAAIFQHHDAITGTFCRLRELSRDQDIGSHDVLGSYETMLRGAIEMSNRVYTELGRWSWPRRAFMAGSPPAELLPCPSTRPSLATC